MREVLLNDHAWARSAESADGDNASARISVLVTCPRQSALPTSGQFANRVLLHLRLST
jgi:hypothetical protein